MSKQIVILGSGIAGTMMANKLRRKLKASEWDITIIDKEKTHYYQPGFLFVPFGMYDKNDIIKPMTKFYPKGIKYINNEAEKIDGEKNEILLKDGKIISYNLLIIATGTRIVPEETPGMKDELWYKNIFDFYTFEGCVALSEFLKSWAGGNMVLNIAEMPIKCPVAPLEFVFLADSYFKKKGIRDKVNITYVTPLSGAFTKPKASQMLGKLLIEKNINIVADFNIAEVNNREKKIIDYAGVEVPFDLLITIPVHMGDAVIENSGLGDDLGFVRTNKQTLQSEKYKNIFVIGDATNIPASKAGSVAHFAADVTTKNIIDFIANKPLEAKFDGHANCYVETGNGKAVLIDFNYETEPLPGIYPYPIIGPFSLLKDTKLNHIGKLLFKWIYWNILLKGRELPVTSHMSMLGKKRP